MKTTIIILISFIFSLSIFSQSEEETRTVLQLCLDIEEFQEFFHDDIEGRVPLVVIDNGIVPKVSGVMKFGEEVLFMSKEDLFFYGRGDGLEFETFLINKKGATVYFKYKVEGAYAKITLEKSGMDWMINTLEIGEY